MVETRLSEQQIAFFKTFGYLQFPGLMADCIDRIVEEFEGIWETHGKSHDGIAKVNLQPFADQSKYLSALLDEPRIHDIAASICGDDFNYLGGSGTLFVGDTLWHSGYYQILSPRIMFYLDRLTRDTGALRVIPGSHHHSDEFGEAIQCGILEGRSATLAAPGINWGVESPEVPAVALETEPGDVLVFDDNLKHASFGGSTRRRLFLMDISCRYPEDQIGELRGWIDANAKSWRTHIGARVHGEAMLRTAGRERWVHLEQVHANDGNYSDLLRKHKKAALEAARG